MWKIFDASGYFRLFPAPNGAAVWLPGDARRGENGATLGKFELAKLAKQYNLDAIHDTVHEMARDEARHGKAFAGLLKRYFNK